MNDFTEHPWTLVTIKQAIEELVKTCVQYASRKLQGEVYTGPITLMQYERFQHLRDPLEAQWIQLPLPSGNRARRAQRLARTRGGQSLSSVAR